MSNNFLEGMQFRAPKHQFPNYDGHEYNDWEDIKNPHDTFKGGTQFRMAPVYTYWVDGTSYKNLDKAMESIRERMEKKDHRFSVMTQIQPREIIVALGSSKVQFGTVIPRTDIQWKNITEFESKGYEWDVRFRLRPDTYWKLSTSAEFNAQAKHEFHDTDLLKKYLNDQISMDNFTNLTLSKVRYA